jgi:hypothetical protein
MMPLHTVSRVVAVGLFLLAVGGRDYDDFLRNNGFTG